ncbi:MAG TPA: DUF6531 domain-containing protein [Pseudobdellovibrionaceae bacterium]|mgnify:CR=1 FL=1|nr:DUF6531 domain-containing protein [Pseudobdellovibrionaceae bacterium]
MDRIIFAFVIVFLLLPIPGKAVVDMKNANYATTWTDMVVPGTGYDLKISRTYNSRSLFNGMFGFGWCSDFETSLDITPEGNLKIKECGGGMEVLYSPREIAKADIETTIGKIVEGMKSDPKALKKSEDIANLKKKLLTDDGERSELAQKYGIKVKIKEGTKFFANGREVEYFVYDQSKKTYSRYLPDSTKQIFNLDGKMVQMSDKNNNYLVFTYDKGSLSEVKDNNNRKLQFKYFPTKKVYSITGPGGLKADYEFSNIDLLSSARDAWQKTYKYQYDKSYNLTLITWPDKSTVKLDYDEKNDWVMGFKDRDNCQENYTYEFEGKDESHYWSTVKKVCGKEVVANNRYEFWYKNRADGKPFLSRVRTEINGDSTDISYDDVFGKPLSISRNQQRTSFEYYPNGLVKKKATSNAMIEFTYQTDSKKVSKVVTTFFNEKNKPMNVATTSFKYDVKGNLNYAENSLGQKISVLHDARGRIVEIKDQAKKVVKVSYEEKFGKPSVISRPGLGTITFKYKSNGDIDKTESKEGPTVLTQVASAFNNFLDVIAPATDEIYL